MEKSKNYLLLAVVLIVTVFGSVVLTACSSFIKGEKGDAYTFNDLLAEFGCENANELKELLKGDKGEKGDNGDKGDDGASIDPLTHNYTMFNIVSSFVMDSDYETEEMYMMDIYMLFINDNTVTFYSGTSVSDLSKITFDIMNINTNEIETEYSLRYNSVGGGDFDLIKIICTSSDRHGVTLSVTTNRCLLWVSDYDLPYTLFYVGVGVK
jgi:hypothetical protein